MTDVDLGDVGFQLQATVNNLAEAAVAKTSGDGDFTRSSAVLYVWDCGEVSDLANSVLSASFRVDNTATGPADNLNGSWRINGASQHQFTGFVRSKVFWRVAAAAVSRSRSTAARSGVPAPGAAVLVLFALLSMAVLRRHR